MHEATQKTQLINGTAQIHFNTSKAIENLSYTSLQDLDNKYLNVFVKVKKHTGRLFEETKMTDVRYILSPYALNLAATPPLKPGIPYSIKVQVEDVSAHSVEGITVALEPKVVDKTQEKRHLAPRKSTTGYDGVASFVVNIPPDATALELHVRTDDPDLPDEHEASNDYQIVAYSSPSQSFLSLNWTESYKSLPVGECFSITVTPKSPHIDKITHYYYLIVSKGKIVHFGREKKLPGSSHQILNLSVTESMAPAARLLVYYIILGEQRTELVSDSVCLSIEDPCSNQLQIHLSPNEDIQGAVSLVMDTQSESWVALTALSTATYDIQERSKNPKERMLGALYKNDAGCGASGGRSSTEVFCLAGLTVLTNANEEAFQQNDGSCKKILRSRRSSKELTDLASQFRHPVIRKCCEDGTRPSRQSCEARARRITIGPKCVNAFLQCCELKESSSNTYVALGRATESKYVIKHTVGFTSKTENWLWEVYHVPKRHQQELAIPGFPATWEIQGVSISDKGLCVADVLHLQVDKDHIQVTRLK
ncbi:complement C5-like [Nannospalax galili]|uniref:complement C5-like n=1 Tax=Nannospalax galili TaxID=1026970 RepID=UPI00111C56EF|nr:complement C5-like [Nannospalax galili]